MPIPREIAAGVDVISPEPVDMPGRSVWERRHSVTYVTAPVYPSPTEAVVFVMSPASSASWDVLVRYGDDWVITRSLGGYQY